jgi:hypothetical protein
MPIDDPTEQIRKIVTDPDDLIDGLAPSGFVGTMIQLGGLKSLVFSVAGICKALYDANETKNRCFTAIVAMCDEMDRLAANKQRELEDLIQTDWFKRAAKLLLEECARATNDERAVSLAKAAANGCFPNAEDEHRREDLAVYIRDLAQLGSDDIQMLNLLRDAYKEVIKRVPNMNRDNDFTDQFDNYKKLISERKIHPDDGLALCARLEGFGLAFEITRNNSRQSVEEHCFRPTRRGMYLLSLLEAAGVPRKQQN